METGATRPTGERERCPECQRDALIALGTRIDEPRRWLRLSRQRTHIYLCRACHAVVTMPQPRKVLAV